MFNVSSVIILLLKNKDTVLLYFYQVSHFPAGSVLPITRARFIHRQNENISKKKDFKIECNQDLIHYSNDDISQNEFQ